MANKRNFTFLKSNYTLRTKHKSLNKKDSAIYVRDFMVTTNNGGWDSGSIPYGEGNMKMIHRFDEKQARKHSYGKWLSNGDSDVWTLEEIKNGLSQYESIRDINRQNVMNTSYNSLLDFAYFGNCTELIKSSITDIIQKFPGELYVTNRSYSYYNEKQDKIVTIVGDSSNGHPSTVPLYYIENPFDIDIFTQSIQPNVENKLKYFCMSRNSYKILNKYESLCGIDMQRWVVKPEPNVNFHCLIDGQFIGKVLLLGKYNGTDIEYYIEYDERDGNKLVPDATFIIYIYFQNGKFVYLTDTVWSGYHIRLSNEKIDEFYQTKLDDFERFLLNRETKPRFLIEIDTLKETDEGFKTGKMKLNWPTVAGGWNLDIESSIYARYVDKLLTQAELYDEYYSNNLWRMMTHDSIKNMDLTFNNEKLDEDASDYNIGTTKVEGLFWAYGREFDDLKRYIDNIKYVNNISRKDNATMAENALYEKCNSSGWDLYNPTQYLNPEVEIKQLYPNQFKTYTLSEVKDRFFTELCLNSKNIFTRKGTKYGIEMLMSLFGFCSYDYGKHSYEFLSKNEQISGKTTWDELNDEEKQIYYDYKIDEFVAVATNTAEDIVDANVALECEEYNKLKMGFASQSEYFVPEPIEGLPIRIVEFINSKDEIKKYMIPWYDRIQYNANKMYFQMYGGWGKISLKDIDETINISPTAQKHFSELRSGGGFKIYSETLKYIKVKENINELLRTSYTELNEGDIYYINDPSEGQYHYYVLTDKEKFGSLQGWTAVTETDFDNKTKNALNVVYLETIIDDYRGNNPHVGYGNYDDGNEYLEYFRHLFKYQIDNDSADKPSFDTSAYDCNTGEVLSSIYDCGFTIGDIVRDNVKTWYFTPTNYEYMDMLEVNTNNGVYSISRESDNQIINVGKKASEEGAVHYESDLSAFNFETQESDSNDEAAANSIINVKNLKLTFANKYINFEGFRKYLYGSVIPYITQIIPSTTILNVEFEGVESSDMVVYDIAQGIGIV